MARTMENPTPKIRLFLVDDEPVVLKGLTLLLSGEPDLEVCGCADSSADALQRIPQLGPDLAVVDLTLKGEDGVDLIRELRQRCPKLKLLVFSMHHQISCVRRALEAGAHGYVTKDEGAEQVIGAIRLLLAGKCYVTPTLAAGMPEIRSRL